MLYAKYFVSTSSMSLLEPFCVKTMTFGEDDPSTPDNRSTPAYTHATTRVVAPVIKNGDPRLPYNPFFPTNRNAPPISVVTQKKNPLSLILENHIRRHKPTIIALTKRYVIPFITLAIISFLFGRYSATCPSCEGCTPVRMSAAPKTEFQQINNGTVSLCVSDDTRLNSFMAVTQFYGDCMMPAHDLRKRHPDKYVRKLADDAGVHFSKCIARLDFPICMEAARDILSGKIRMGDCDKLTEKLMGRNLLSQ